MSSSKALGLAGMLAGMATMRGRLKRVLRNVVLSVVNHLRPAKQRLLMNLSGLSRKKLVSLEKAAAVAPSEAR